ncbi:unnamed protein product [Schistosoma curassoni]|uniref:Uncharacterized protein n=1 Tax=Schistosoma curassoni TaxID=6186 RepID=A0A183L5V6_9TREM|nr:unnamed protein product [Schistosoma curassoni]
MFSSSTRLFRSDTVIISTSSLLMEDSLSPPIEFDSFVLDDFCIEFLITILLSLVKSVFSEVETFKNK